MSDTFKRVVVALCSLALAVSQTSCITRIGLAGEQACAMNGYKLDEITVQEDKNYNALYKCVKPENKVDYCQADIYRSSAALRFNHDDSLGTKNAIIFAGYYLIVPGIVLYFYWKHKRNDVISESQKIFDSANGCTMAEKRQGKKG